MLTTAAFNFFLAMAGMLAIFLISVRLQGIGSFSAPFFVIIAGVVCAVASASFMTASASFGYTSPIIGYAPTIITLVLYAISEARDVMETRAGDKSPKQTKGGSNG